MIAHLKLKNEKITKKEGGRWISEEWMVRRSRNAIEASISHRHLHIRCARSRFPREQQRHSAECSLRASGWAPAREWSGYRARSHFDGRRTPAVARSRALAPSSPTHGRITRCDHQWYYKRDYINKWKHQSVNRFTFIIPAFRNFILPHFLYK